MKHEIVVEALSDLGNFAVVQLPGRKYPGVVIQGDSLWSLRCQVYELLANMRASQASPETVEEASLLCEDLDSMVQRYERSLQENGLKLPYVRP